MIETHFLENTITVFKNYKSLAEKAFTQLTDDKHFHYLLNSESNSIAVIIKHMSGNMISRWTDFLTTDGEKPNRKRDGEFISNSETREVLLKEWSNGWDVLMKTLYSLKENDVMKTITIRGEELTVVQALIRQTAHYAYHTGQIILIAKHIKGEDWKSLSIPKNKSEEHMKGNYLKGL